MALNTVALGVKLGALRAKDPDAIMAQQPALPFIGTNYTRAQLVAWLQTRIDLMQQALDGAYTDAQINTFMLNLYNSLGSADQAIATAIWNRTDYDIGQASNWAAYNKLASIVLYRFVTTP